MPPTVYGTKGWAEGVATSTRMRERSFTQSKSDTTLRAAKIGPLPPAPLGTGVEAD